MLLIKARVKTQEEMPKSEMCCEATINDMLPFFGMDVVVVYPAIPNRTWCPHCGFDFDKRMSFMLQDEFAAYPQDTIHLDEAGPYAS